MVIDLHHFLGMFCLLSIIYDRKHSIFLFSNLYSIVASVNIFAAIITSTKPHVIKYKSSASDLFSIVNPDPLLLSILFFEHWHWPLLSISGDSLYLEVTQLCLKLRLYLPASLNSLCQSVLILDTEATDATETTEATEATHLKPWLLL